MNRCIDSSLSRRAYPDASDLRNRPKAAKKKAAPMMARGRNN
jgi:hypothetical protein